MRKLVLLVLSMIISIIARGQEHKTPPSKVLGGSTCAREGIPMDEYPYSHGKDRDPLNPLINERSEILITEEKGSKEIDDFLLQGVIYSLQGSTAIIDNELFKEGDVLGDYKIMKIESRRVILEKAGEKLILKWEEEQ